jgi:hypothetical protein
MGIEVVSDGNAIYSARYGNIVTRVSVGLLHPARTFIFSFLK